MAHCFACRHPQPHCHDDGRCPPRRHQPTQTDFPDYADKLRLVAADPVSSALFYHAMIDAVVSCLLRFGATDGDGGVLGRVKGYVGMTEEQRRLSHHCHLLVSVFGYNDFASFRDLMDQTPERYGELAEFLNRVIFNQVASISDVSLAVSGTQDGVPGQPVAV